MNKFARHCLYIFPFMKRYHAYLCTGIKKVSYLSFVIRQIFKTKPYWPSSSSCVICCPERIFVGKNSNIGREGCYLQGKGGIFVGNYVIFSSYVAIMSTNHDLYNQNKSNEKPIIIHDYCWLGLGCKITSGVELGPRTIVGAGSVVTKSFPEGYCVVAGNPAKVVKYLDKSKFTPWYYQHEFYGCVPDDKFRKNWTKYVDDNLPFLNLIHKNLK